jgi:hypothetical protein
MILVNKSKFSEALKKQGLSKNEPDSKFDSLELSIGTLIELEHTNDKEVACEIAKDHLHEKKDYYKNSLFKEEREEALKVLKKKEFKKAKALPEGKVKKRKHLKGQKKVAVVMKEFARGTLHDSSGKIVKDKSQALAIAMSEAGLSKSILCVVKSPTEILNKSKSDKLKKIKLHLLKLLDRQSFEKSKALPVGTTRTWKGKEFRKKEKAVGDAFITENPKGKMCL